MFWFIVGSVGKESACNVGVLGLIRGSGRSPGEGNDSSFQYSCLENSMDRGAGQASVCKEWDMTVQLTFNFYFKEKAVFILFSVLDGKLLLLHS